MFISQVTMPIDTVLLLDISASMGESGLPQLKRAVWSFIDGVIQTARDTGLLENVAVVTFGGPGARILIPLCTEYLLIKAVVCTCCYYFHFLYIVKEFARGDSAHTVWYVMRIKNNYVTLL